MTVLLVSGALVFIFMWTVYRYAGHGHFHWWHYKKIAPHVYAHMGPYQAFSVYRHCRCGGIEVRGAHELGTYWFGVNQSADHLAWMLLSERS